jgi:hypothetical protein
MPSDKTKPNEGSLFMSLFMAAQDGCSDVLECLTKTLVVYVNKGAEQPFI